MDTSLFAIIEKPTRLLSTKEAEQNLIQLFTIAFGVSSRKKNTLKVGINLVTLYQKVFMYETYLR